MKNTKEHIEGRIDKVRELLRKYKAERDTKKFVRARTLTIKLLKMRDEL